jgi:hypothetical protein
VVLAEERRPGAYVVTRLDTTDADGEPVCTTYQASVYRGVAVDGGDRVHAEPPPPPPAGFDARELSMAPDTGNLTPRIVISIGAAVPGSAPPGSRSRSRRT